MSGDRAIAVVVDAEQLSVLLREPGFMAALRAAWTGHGSVDDALHWRLQPGSIAPSGAPDPADALLSLRRVAYGRPTGVESVAAARALGDLEAQIADRRRALDDAIERALNRRSNPLPTPVMPGRFELRIRAHPVASVALAVVATLVGLVLLPTQGRELGEAISPESATLAVFDRPQIPADLAPPVFTGGQDAHRQAVRDTTRLLGRRYGVSVYAYRDSTGRVCLLTTASGDHSSSVCVPTKVFEKSGVSVGEANYGVRDAAAGVSERSLLSFRWAPDGRLQVRVG